MRQTNNIVGEFKNDPKIDKQMKQSTGSITSEKKITREVRKPQNEHDKGMKFDFGKLRWDLIPYDALEKLVEVFTHGSVKYTDENWRKGMEWKRVYRAAFSHLQKAFRGEDIDPDSGCIHLSQVIWNCLTLINYQMNNIGIDNRVKDLNDRQYQIENKDDIKKQTKLFWETIEKF